MRNEDTDRGEHANGLPGDGDEVVRLTSAERAAFRRLAREKEPSESMEAGVVHALRERGVLAGAGKRGRRPLARSWGGAVSAWAVAAAGFLLFLVGGLAGHRLGARAATDALLEVREQDLALRIQEEGSAYVRSLVALESLLQANGSEVAGEYGREVATTTLYAAARVLARLDPADPVSPALVDALGQRLFGDMSDGVAVVRTFSF